MSRASRIFGSMEKILLLFLISGIFSHNQATAQSTNSYSDQMQQAKAKLLQSLRKGKSMTLFAMRKVYTNKSR